MEIKDGVPSIDGYNPRPGDVKFKNLMDDERGTNMISSGNNTLNNPGDRKVIVMKLLVIFMVLI